MHFYLQPQHRRGDHHQKFFLYMCTRGAYTSHGYDLWALFILFRVSDYAATIRRQHPFKETSSYRRRWLLSACTYNSWQQGNMRLTADMRWTRKRLGGKIVGDAFAASVKPLVQHARASSKYFGERHLWPSHLQAALEAAYRRDNTNLGTGVGQQPWQSPQACYCPWPCSLRVFAGVLALPQAQRDHYTERPLLVKLPRRSVVELVLFVLCTTGRVLLKVRLLSACA